MRFLDSPTQHSPVPLPLHRAPQSTRGATGTSGTSAQHRDVPVASADGRSRAMPHSTSPQQSIRDIQTASQPTGTLPASHSYPGASHSKGVSSRDVPVALNSTKAGSHSTAAVPKAMRAAEDHMNDYGRFESSLDMVTTV
jgi:hypothetical protein